MAVFPKVWYTVLATYNKIMLSINTPNDRRWMPLGWRAALMRRGVAAKAAIRVPMRWVIALPGSFAFTFLTVIKSTPCNLFMVIYFIMDGSFVINT